MKRVMKKIGIVFLVIIAIIVAIAVIGFSMMGKKTRGALDKQKNVEIDMSQVQDGTYEGSSDGGMVQVEVEVQVKDHKIEKIDLIKHENGKGKPAEAIILEMVEGNTYDVDAVSGATASSKTIKNAVNVALQKGIQ